MLVAVSGGADSMALLHLLHRAGVSCGVAYFDHHTRQGASEEDGRFVAGVAADLNLPFHLGGADVAKLALAQGESFEMAARRVRYAFLIDMARAQGYTAIATGHHQDDQAETVLLRLLRGASPSGLSGISPRREECGVPLIRPLLETRREEIIAWLKGAGLGWRDDVSNEDPDFLRNRVRHELLPLLSRAFNPGIVDALTRFSRLQRMDSAFMDVHETEARHRCESPPDGINRAAFRQIDPSLQFRCMTRWIRHAGGEPEFGIVSRAVDFVLRGAAGRRIDLGRGAALHTGALRAVFVPGVAVVAPSALDVPVPGEARGFGQVFQVRLLASAPEQPIAAYCDARCQVFDGAALGDTITIRQWRAGDRIQPLGMTGSRKLKAVYNDLGLSAPERASQIVVESGGRIVWVPGYGIGRDVAVSGQTTSFVELRIVEA